MDSYTIKSNWDINVMLNELNSLVGDSVDVKLKGSYWEQANELGAGYLRITCTLSADGNYDNLYYNISIPKVASTEGFEKEFISNKDVTATAEEQAKLTEAKEAFANAFENMVIKNGYDFDSFKADVKQVVGDEITVAGGKYTHSSATINKPGVFRAYIKIQYGNAYDYIVVNKEIAQVVPDYKPVVMNEIADFYMVFADFKASNTTTKDDIINAIAPYVLDNDAVALVRYNVTKSTNGKPGYVSFELQVKTTVDGVTNKVVANMSINIPITN